MTAGSKAQAPDKDGVELEGKPDTKGASRRDSARRLSFVGVALASLIFAMIPVAFGPGQILIVSWVAFEPVKFILLIQLSAALLIAVLGSLALRDKPYYVPVLLPVLLFLGVSTISTLMSDNIVRSTLGTVFRFDGLLSLACGVLLFYAAAKFLDSWAKVRVFLIAGVASAVIISGYGLLQVFGLDPVLQMGMPWAYMQEPVEGNLAPLYGSMDRVFSTIGYPISLAAYLTLMMGATLALYFNTDARWERWVWLAAVALMAACWLYTYTRGAMLGCAVAILILAFLAYRRLGTFRPLILPTAVVVVGILGAVLFNPLADSDISSQVGGTNIATNPGDVPSGGDMSVTTRLLMWRDSIPMIVDRPLFGYGPDNFAEPFKRYESEDLRSFFPEGQTTDKAHNELFQVAATTGLLGLAAYLWIFVSYFRKSYKSGGWPLLALSGGVLAYILQLMTWVTTITTGVTFWAILGVSVAIMRIQSREKAADSSPASGEAAAYAESAGR